MTYRMHSDEGGSDTTCELDDQLFEACAMKRVVNRPKDFSVTCPTALETMSTEIPLEGDSRSWLVPLMYGGQLILFLLDTGANVSMMNVKIFQSRYPEID